MALNRYNLKKWIKMFLKKSDLHVNQGIGQFMSVDDVGGYYNDFRGKVNFSKKTDYNELPLTMLENGKSVLFPTAIFQFGLGLYDLYLETHDLKYKNSFIKFSDWAVSSQEINGAWNNFYFSMPQHPYSCMSQGEGASLLARTYILTKESKYLRSALLAIDFMLIDKKNGGVSDYENDQLVLLEYTNKSVVLNGWIFGIFGLVDIMKISDNQKYRDAFMNTIDTLKIKLKDFDNGFWSTYDLSRKTISSRFYHQLHISQIDALYQLTNDRVFKNYFLLFKKYDRNYINRTKAFFVKAKQKIYE